MAFSSFFKLMILGPVFDGSSGTSSSGVMERDHDRGEMSSASGVDSPLIISSRAESVESESEREEPLAMWMASSPVTSGLRISSWMVVRVAGSVLRRWRISSLAKLKD